MRAVLIVGLLTALTGAAGLAHAQSPPGVDCSTEAIAHRAPVPREGGPESWPDDPKSARNLGNQYANRGVENLTCGEFDAAIEAFNIALRGDKANPLTYAGRAQAYLRLQRPQQALDDYNAAIAAERSGSGDFAAYRLSFYAARAVAERDLGQFEAAVKDLTYVLDNPDNAPPVALNLVVVYQERRVEAALGAKDWAHAWQWADSLWQRFRNIPVDWRYVYMRGRALQGLGRMKEAADDYDTTISMLTAYRPQTNDRLDPFFVEAYTHKGQAYAAPGPAQNWLEARTAYLAALKIDPDYAPAKDGLGAAPAPPPLPTFTETPYRPVPTVSALRADIPAGGFCKADDKNHFIDRINDAINATLTNVALADQAIAANAAERAAYEANKLITFDERVRYLALMDGFRRRLDDERRQQGDARRPLDDFNVEVRAMKVAGC